MRARLGRSLPVEAENEAENEEESYCDRSSATRELVGFSKGDDHDGDHDDSNREDGDHDDGNREDGDHDDGNCDDGDHDDGDCDDGRDNDRDDGPPPL